MEKISSSEILKRQYLGAKELTQIIPNLKINTARKYINELQEKMIEDGYFIPKCRPKVVLTNYVKNKFLKKGNKNEA